MADPEKIIGMPEGMFIGSLWTTERQCGWPACDSWRTLGIDVVEHRHGRSVEKLYPLCVEHMAQFLDVSVLRSTGVAITTAVESDPEPDLEVEPE